MLSGIYPFGNLKFSSVHHCYHSLPYKVASGEGRGVITTFFSTVLGWLLLEKEMAAHSSTLAWKIPWTEEPGRLQSMGLQRVGLGCSPWGRKESDTTEQLHFHFSLSCIGEGNGSLLHCSCLENPRDVRAWWAAIYGLQSRTRLKRRSSSSRLASITQERLYWFKATFQMAALNTYPAGLVATWNLYTKGMF